MFRWTVVGTFCNGDLTLLGSFVRTSAQVPQRPGTIKRAAHSRRPFRRDHCRHAPSSNRLLDAITSFENALKWPETQQRVQSLLECGLQGDFDFENRRPEVPGTLLET